MGADKRGIVHTVRATAANVADITQLPELLHGQERKLFGDQAYWKEDDREFLQEWGMRFRVNRRPTSQRPLSERWRMINRERSRTRARGEHAFRVVKQLWGFKDYRAIDISPDRPVQRVFKRLGLVPQDASIDQLLYRARELSPEFPGLLDLATFEIGRAWCKAGSPLCPDCYMKQLCPSSH